MASVVTTPRDYVNVKLLAQILAELPNADLKSF